MITDKMATAAANQRRGSRATGAVVAIGSDLVTRVTCYPMPGMTRALEWGVGPRVMRRVPDDWIERPYQSIDVVPYTLTIGAEIRGVDLREPLRDAVRDEIRRALLEWKVLFFRNQDITSEQQVT